MLSNLDALAIVIEAHGPIKTVRVDQARRVGPAEWWGVSFYTIKLSHKNRVPVSLRTQRARPETLSPNSAFHMALNIATERGLLYFSRGPGRLSDDHAAELLRLRRRIAAARSTEGAPEWMPSTY